MADVNGCARHEDALVELVTGQVRVERRRGVEAHLEACPACRERLRVMRAVRNATVAVPDGLEARIRYAVREAARRSTPATKASSARPRGRSLPTASWWRPLVPLAAAAALTGILIAIGDGAGTIRPDLAGDDYAPYGAWPATDGFVAGEAVLSDLTVEELEHLLEEMES